MEYTKSASGGWADAEKIQDGTKVKLMTECIKQESKFKDSEGNTKTENVATARFQGQEAPVNVRLNWTTIYGLIDAFGKDSKDWVGKVLTVKKREQSVGDKVYDVLYYIPEGFEMIRNAEKRLEIKKIGDKEIVEDYPEEDINTVPF